MRSCGNCYTGKTRRSFKIRLKEHAADIKNNRIRSSALAEHLAKACHHICLKESKIITKEKHQYKWKIREALEIIKHP